MESKSQASLYQKQRRHCAPESGAHALIIAFNMAIAFAGLCFGCPTETAKAKLETCLVLCSFEAPSRHIICPDFSGLVGRGLCRRWQQELARSVHFPSRCPLFPFLSHHDSGVQGSNPIAVAVGVCSVRDPGWLLFFGTVGLK